MKPATRNPTIPHDIIVEIFSWLPVKSLMQFRCVSKKLNSLMLESDFVDIHHRRSMTRDGGTKFFMRKSDGFYTIEQKEDGKTSKWNFINRSHCRIIANGLVCFWKSHVEPVSIYNPSTREVIHLPSLERNFFNSPDYYYSLGYEPEEKKYKVLMTVKVSSEPMRSWVFTLSVDESWREIECLDDFDLCLSNKVCIRGIIYMLDYRKNFIVAFNIKAENFRIIRLENVLYNCISHFKLLEVKEKLALLDCYKCFSGQKDLWILENFEKEEWKSHSIQIPSQWKGMEDKLRPTFSDCYRLCCSYNGEIVFIVIKTNILECNFYDVSKNSWRYLEIQRVPPEDVIYDINSYVESLYSLGKKLHCLSPS